MDKQSGGLAMDMEREMWASVLERDVARFRQLVSPAAVMICGGVKCTGEEYAGFVADFNIARIDIRDMAVTFADERCVHLHYIVETFVEGPENDLSGAFHVTSLWEKAAGGWQLIFNMDSRVCSFGGPA